MNTTSLPDETNATKAKIENRVRIACVLALVALALIVYSLLVPKPLPVIVAMSVAQGIGTLSLAIFLYIVGPDIWRFMAGKPSPQEKPKDETSSPQ